MSEKINSEKLLNLPKQESKSSIPITLSLRGYAVKESDIIDAFGAHALERIKQKMTITTIQNCGPYKTTKTMMLYKRVMSGKTALLLFARFSEIENLFQSLFTRATFTYKCTIPPGEDIKLDSTLQLYENQKIAFDYIVENVYNEKRVKKGHASCVFVMDTGLGKTYFGGAVINYLRKKTLIVLPNSTALLEWLEMLQNSFTGLQIGQYHSRTKHTDGDVVIGVVNSLLQEKFTWDKVTMPYNKYFEQFGLVIYDECHSYPTDTRQEIFWRTNFKYGLALTATPDERQDGMDSIVQHHLGPIVQAADIPGFNVEEIKWKGEVHIVKYYGPDEYTKNIKGANGFMQCTAMYKQFMEDPYRTQMIINYIIRLYKKKRDMFVFVELCEHVTIFRDKLIKEGIEVYTPELPDASAGTLMGGATLVERHAAKKWQITIITLRYGMQSLSMPDKDTIILASPRKNNIRQLLGRILRRSGDTSITRIIIDIVDACTNLQSQLSERKKIYTEKGFKLIQEKVKYQSIQSAY